jgi:heme-degrading monooxygenase HmoA
MAECGEKVIWGVNGQKQVVGGTGKTQDELQAAIKQGDWNDYVIIARGNHLVHQINGNPMIEVTDSDPKHRSLSGIIALQIHRNSGKPTKVQFKDIRLKRLTKGPADPSAKAAGETTASRGSPPDLRPGQRWTNSLGMVFVTVPGTKVLFSIWETRVQDFDAFVNASGYQTGRTMYGHRRDGWKERNSDWRNPGFVQAADHPVVGVNWDDAQAFCRWLTAKEQSERNLDHNRQYRLPTDAEWSQAVGTDKFP